MTSPKPWVKFEEVSSNHGKFVVSPLNRGMGTTIGNALRRVLLSSLQGSAVTAVRIEGVTHEFGTIPNVVEDVIDVICNLKSLVFKVTDLSAQYTAKLEFKGSGSVRANQFELPTGLTLINTDQHIAEISKDTKISIEIVVGSGVGYRSSESNTTEGSDVKTIFVDSSFSPIVRVNHKVENMRVGKELDYDELQLEIFTNGSISAEESATQAAQILMSQIGLFNQMNEEPIIDAQTDLDSDASNRSAVLTMSVDDLELSARSSNCLKRAGIDTVHQLLEKEFDELLKIKNFGEKSIEEINEKLSQYGVALQTSQAVSAI